LNEDKAEIARVKFEEVQKMQKEVKDKHRSKMYKLEKRMKDQEKAAMAIQKAKEDDFARRKELLALNKQDQ